MNKRLKKKLYKEVDNKEVEAALEANRRLLEANKELEEALAALEDKIEVYKRIIKRKNQ